MKFEYNKEKYVDLGLIVKHGNVQNIVMFWDENKNAVSYILEFYRIDWNYKEEGFFHETSIQEREVELYDYRGSRKEIDKYLPISEPAIVSNNFASMREWNEGNGGPKRSEVTFYKFDKAKPVCTIIVERNKFYHSINDLPCGDCIVCLKVENRNGEVYAESAPYYFHINDAEQTVNKRADSIASAAAGNIVGW